MAKLERNLTGDFDQLLRRLHLTAITSGGSQAMLFKINTLDEEAFLDVLRDLLP